MDDYMTDPGAKRTDKTLLSYRILFDALEELIGADKMAAEISREDCKRVRALLMTLPKNARKHYPKKSLRDAARLAKADGKPLMAPGTINSYLINLSSLFNWAVDEHIIERNPAKGLQIVDPVKDKDKKKPVPLEDLPTLFRMPLYIGCIDACHNYRHEEGVEEPSQPSIDLAVSLISTGSAQLRWLISLDQADKS
jgi:hypothetical protein